MFTLNYQVHWYSKNNLTDKIKVLLVKRVIFLIEIKIFRTMDVVTKTLEIVEDEPDDHQIETKNTIKTPLAVQFNMNNVQKARVL